MADAPKKPKSRVSYPAGLRSQAKAAVGGLITVSITFPNGEREERQLVGNASECRFARWAAALLENPDARPVPDLEQLVRQHINHK